MDKKKVPKPKILRAGHPARMLSEVVDFSLEHILQSTSATEVVKEVNSEIVQKTRSLDCSTKTQRSQIYKELKILRKELIVRQRKAVKELLQTTDILLTTSTGCDSKYLNLSRLADEIGGFDVIVIDEAAQSLEAACWIPILLGKKVVLAGDHLQLPPTILSRNAAGKQPNGLPGLEETLFDRLMNYDKSITRLLDIQYRMNYQIMKWSSDALYDGKLFADDSVRSHLLCDLPEVKKTILTQVPLCFIDTCGELNEQKFDEEDLEKSNKLSKCIELESKWNEGEAEIVKNMVEELLSNGLKQNDIGVITPYNAQVEILRSLISYENIEIGTVDGFQGREKEVILISTVRSNDHGDIGFLSERRRMNVAITRARRLVIVVCDSTTVNRDEFLNNMIEYFQFNKECLYLTHLDYQMQLQQSQEGNIVANSSQTSLSYAKQKAKSKQEKQITRLQQSEEKIKNVTDVTKKKCNDLEVIESTNKMNLEKQIKDFCSNDDEISLTFPPDTKSYLRKYIHELAELNNLLHVTEQIGNDRVITISKIKKEENIEQTNETKQEKSEEEEEQQQNSEIKNQNTQPNPSKKKNKKKNKKNKKPVVNPCDKVLQKESIPVRGAPVISGQKAKRKEGEDIDSILAQLSIKLTILFLYLIFY